MRPPNFHKDGMRSLGRPGSDPRRAGRIRSREFAEQGNERALHAEEFLLVICGEGEGLGHSGDHGGQTVIHFTVRLEIDELSGAAGIVSKQNDGEFGATAYERSHGGAPVAAPEPCGRSQEESYGRVVDQGVCLRRDDARNWRLSNQKKFERDG